MPAHRQDGAPRRRGHYVRRRLYIRSLQCIHCGRDYLYPDYGGRSRVCNDCIDTRKGL